MDQKITRRLAWWITIILLFVLSYWREVGFRSINAIMAGEINFYAKTTELPFLYDLTRTQLNQLKYFLTGAFSIVFISLTYLGIKFSFPEKEGISLAKIIYAICILIAFIILFLAFIFQQFQTFYPYLRILVGWIHSPLIFLFVSVGIYSSNVLKKKDI
jgi:hypothetical protein